MRRGAKPQTSACVSSKRAVQRDARRRRTRYSWDPQPIPKQPSDFIDGMTTMCGKATRRTRGLAVHIYLANGRGRTAFS